MSLCISRKVGERIVIGDKVTVTVYKASGNRVGLAIDAPPDVRIEREELRDQKQEPTA